MNLQDMIDIVRHEKRFKHFITFWTQNIWNLLHRALQKWAIQQKCELEWVLFSPDGHKRTNYPGCSSKAPRKLPNKLNSFHVEDKLMCLVLTITPSHQKNPSMFGFAAAIPVLESVQAEVLHCSARVICNQKNFQWVISIPVDSHSPSYNSLLSSSCSQVTRCVVRHCDHQDTCTRKLKQQAME